MKVNGTLSPVKLPNISTAPHAAPARAEERSAQSDRLELSRKAVEKMREQEKAHLEEMARVKEDAEAAREQAEATAKAFKAQMLCLKIAGRIIAGDKVPSQDEQYLMENDPKLYQMAVSARMPKEDPEEYDSLLEDDEEDQAPADASAPASAPDMSQAAADGEIPAEEVPM